MGKNTRRNILVIALGVIMLSLGIYNIITITNYNFKFKVNGNEIISKTKAEKYTPLVSKIITIFEDENNTYRYSSLVYDSYYVSSDKYHYLLEINLNGVDGTRVKFKRSDVNLSKLERDQLFDYFKDYKVSKKNKIRKDLLSY
jgi:hypothetical protein